MSFKPMELHVTKQVVDWTTLKCATSTTSTAPFYMPTANGYLISLHARVTTAFAGVTHPTVELGTTTDTTLMMRKQPVGSAGQLRVGGFAGQQGYCPALDNPGGATTNYALVLTFRSASGNFSSLTAGEIEFVTVYATEK